MDESGCGCLIIILILVFCGILNFTFSCGGITIKTEKKQSEVQNEKPL